eukprot:scaffold10899_cov70-Phaeocystis_antarctica.AAC.2
MHTRHAHAMHTRHAHAMHTRHAHAMHTPCTHHAHAMRTPCARHACHAHAPGARHAHAMHTRHAHACTCHAHTCVPDAKGKHAALGMRPRDQAAPCHLGRRGEHGQGTEQPRARPGHLRRAARHAARRAGAPLSTASLSVSSCDPHPPPPPTRSLARRHDTFVSTALSAALPLSPYSAGSPKKAASSYLVRARARVRVRIRVQWSGLGLGWRPRPRTACPARAWPRARPPPPRRPRRPAGSRSLCRRGRAARLP